MSSANTGPIAAAPSSKPTRGQRRARAAGQASARPIEQAAFIGGHVNPPLPGLPTIFISAAPSVSVERRFTIDVLGFLDHVEYGLERCAQSARFNQVLNGFVDAPLERTNYVRDWRRAMRGAAFLALAQQLVEAHRTIKNTSEDTSSVYGPLNPVPQFIRKLCAAYGEFRTEDSGEEWLFPGYIETVRALMRVGHLILTRDPYVSAQSFYFPTEAVDPNVDRLLAAAVVRIMERNPITAFRVDEPDAVFVNLPPWITAINAASAPAAADAAALAFIFGARPNLVGYAVAGFDSAISALFERQLTLDAGTPFPAWAAIDCGAWKTWAGEITAEAGRFASFNEAVFYQADKASLASMGSASQCFKRTAAGDDGHVAIWGNRPSTIAMLSLAAAFPHHLLWEDHDGVPRQTRLTTRYVASISIANVRTNFINASIKNVA